MVTTLLGSLLALITFLISLLHFYWVFGGQWALTGVIPTKADGSTLFKAGPFATLVVALLMLLISLYYCSIVCPYPLPLIDWFTQYGLPLLGIGFLARSIGDFQYVGFFKKVRNTVFGRLDSKYFSPLCLLLALGSFVLYYLKN